MPGLEFLGEEERREVQEVLETGILSRYGFSVSGNSPSKAKAFEAELARRLDVQYCHACSSGTAALSIALAAAGIGVGDEVIVPPFTFIATVEAVLLAGAVPVFADIDETLGLDPQAVEAAITVRTRAVIVVHMCGSMASIDLLAELCRHRGLFLIEDTAQALGATFGGQALGTFGDIGCYSFDGVKTITCGEGGAIVTHDRALYEWAAQYADHGHDHRGVSRGQDGHPFLGTNYRISELQAAVGIAQLRKLERILELQRSHQRMLREALAAHLEVSLRKTPDRDGDSATFFSFFLPSESRARAVQQDFQRLGRESFIHWFGNDWHYLRSWHHLRKLQTCARSPLHMREALLDYTTEHLQQSDCILARCLSLPIKLSWTRQDLDCLLATIAACFDGKGNRNAQEPADGYEGRVRTGSLQPT